ncbi:hypothetical protein D9615_005391 [Tricholomella constricta]|uniref:Uncharacterized protein n=1 Tax=Tricholomella constricta TaxID=117010 RepID=A0A8H5HDX2_9AGAR|nr:hypothetical protein D9615_005391 [Tricholomella constricta]
MAIKLPYTPLNGEQDLIGQEDISSVLQNPTPVDNSRNDSRKSRVLTLLAALALVSIVFYACTCAPTSRRDETTADIADDPRLEPYQSPDDAEFCAEWPIADEGPGPHLSTVSFELPGTSDLMFLLSRGPAAGHLNIIKKNPNHSSKVIEVNVTAQYEKRIDLQRTKACRTGRDSKNEHGVLIWAQPRHPRYNRQMDPVSFNITLALPQSLREYKDLSTDLPTFSHQIGDFFDLWSPTAFNTIRLKTSHAPIAYGALCGERAFIQTSDAEVNGYFCGSNLLSVRTSNARIHTIAMMFAQAQGAETKVHLQTTNAPAVAFLSVESDFTEAKLSATIHTSNGKLNVNMPRQPFGGNASFYLDASTSNAPATVVLHPDYEGTYDLKTSVADALIEETDMKDPSGMGRERTVERTSEGHRTRGSIFWSYNGEPSEEGKKRGSVRVRSSKLPVKMYC